jgi:hypothetical protein
MLQDTDFIVDTARHPGFVSPPYNKTWPTFATWPSSAILIRAMRRTEGSPKKEAPGGTGSVGPVPDRSEAPPATPPTVKEPARGGSGDKRWNERDAGIPL